LADVQSDVLLPSRMHTIAFSIDRLLRRFVIMLAHVLLMRCIKSLVSRTCVLYNVNTFLHQSPNSVVDRVSGSIGLIGGQIWRDKIRRFLLKELDCFTQ